MITLKVEQLKKSFGNNTVFSGISFDHNGNTLGIAGSNGSGKSTFLKCLSGLLNPNNGEIFWHSGGDEIPKNQFKNMLGYAAPYINLYNELSCRENLSFLADVRHEETDETAINYWIDKVELPHVADQPFGKLSTGQQQRLRLASALFHNPDILMLDEPGSNLDEAGRTLINNIVDTFQSPDKLLIIASNSPEELQLCEHVFSIEQQSFV
ncbi:ABC transporter ATP-binding protein [Fodinibius halophilus]|uniref:ABC transporter ATP-binding protein n=1 Tax=Fodinibius halophilus TaxID=1736908 RepID=A0A6M1T985_9BACT|nr:ABC transporter ATP-binding protein [Fodinibius halophilus]NGP87594.1 ABC transporter ATP-binding protein [Fodinibius halophilus]